MTPTTKTKPRALLLTPRQLQNRLTKARKQGLEEGIRIGRLQAIQAQLNNRVVFFGQDVDKGEVVKRTVAANDETGIIQLLDIECGLT